MNILALILICSIVDKALTAQLPITIDQNGYTGVTVAISDSVPESTVLLDRIKIWLTEASKVLYKATKYQLYFKDITIVLPQSWSIQNSYRKISGRKFKRAHVRIDEENPVVGKVPYVFGMTGCGKPGQYMHLTPYLMFAGEYASFGEIGDVFVHEWGHLRWGLYDEYASYEEASLDAPTAFYLDDGTWKPVRCTEEVTGRRVNIITRAPCTINSDGIPEKDCVFEADGDSIATASLMGHQYVKKMEAFCDKDDDNTEPRLRHNSRAPNNQNIKCNERSAREVMREHSDFIGRVPGVATKDTTPQFTMEIETNPRICLCLDVSGSMANNNRRIKMVTAVSNFILNIVENGTSVGIVTFSNQANIVHPMLTVAGQDHREQLVASLPTSDNGATSIGAGILSCITNLNSSNDGLDGSIVYVVSDGQETAGPYISDVQPIVTSFGIIVSSLALGEQADEKLGEISRATGGKSFFYSEESNSTALTDAFSSTVEIDSADGYSQIDSVSFTVSSGQDFSHTFIIDESIGRDTLIQVLTDENSDIKLRVVGPDRSVYQQTQSERGITSLKILNTAKTGIYSVTVTSTSSNAPSATLTIDSRSRLIGGSTITTDVWLSDETLHYDLNSPTVVYVAVLKGMAPVIYVDVRVYIESNGIHTTLQLKDNGIGSDMKPNDGIYSGYILSSVFHENGRHSLKVKIISLNDKAKMLVSTERTDTFPYFSGVTTASIGNFQRVVLSNEITVVNYTSIPLPDNIPPSKITTLGLQSVQYNGNKVKIEISWKAVGDDLDIGTAAQYDVRLSDSFQSIQQTPDSAFNVLKDIPLPKQSGSLEQLIIEYDNTSTTMFIVVRAIDGAGNKGDYSNIVSISKLTDLSWTTSADNFTLVEVAASSSVVLIILIAMIGFIFVIKKLSSRKQDFDNEKQASKETKPPPLSFSSEKSMWEIHKEKQREREYLWLKRQKMAEAYADKERKNGLTKDRHNDILKNRQSDMQRHRHDDMQRPRHNDMQRPRHNDMQRPRHNDMQKPRHNDMQRPRHNDIPKDRQNGKQKDKHNRMQRHNEMQRDQQIDMNGERWHGRTSPYRPFHPYQFDFNSRHHIM